MNGGGFVGRRSDEKRIEGSNPSRSIEGGFRNAKHRAQWRSTIWTYATAILDKPLTEIVEGDVIAVLKDVWLEKPETARRLRGRIERILAAAKVQGLRAGENPAAYKNHLKLLLPSQPKHQVSHHASLDFKSLPTFMTDLRARRGSAARALEFAILTAARSGKCSA